MALEERMAKVEGILEEVRTRLNHFESRFDQIDRRFNWLMGIMLTMWVTIILTIIFKG
ncbi:MAG: hypothetical protein ACOYU0_01775 [Nitrospirota bacterium]